MTASVCGRVTCWVFTAVRREILFGPRSLSKVTKWPVSQITFLIGMDVAVRAVGSSWGLLNCRVCKTSYETLFFIAVKNVFVFLRSSSRRSRFKKNVCVCVCACMCVCFVLVCVCSIPLACRLIRSFLHFYTLMPFGKQQNLCSWYLCTFLHPAVIASLWFYLCSILSMRKLAKLYHA